MSPLPWAQISSVQNFQVLQALADEVDPTPHTLSQGDGQIDSEEPRPEDPKP